MKIKTNYFLIPLLVLLVSATGNLITDRGMVWYDTINLPSFTPPGYVIGLVWTVIFILSTISALMFYNKKERTPRFILISLLFLNNALLNVFWSVLFFKLNLVGLAVIEMIVLNLTNLALIILLWPRHRIAAYLLFPYFLWVSFATYLAYTIWTLN